MLCRAALVRLHTGRPQAEPIGVGRSSGRRQQVGAFERALPVRRAARQLDPAILVLLCALGLGLQVRLYAASLRSTLIGRRASSYSPGSTAEKSTPSITQIPGFEQRPVRLDAVFAKPAHR
jgi:hypothetical protein